MSTRISSLTPGLVIGTRAARVSVLPGEGRLSLRARAAGIPALGKALGLTLPDRIGRRAASGKVEAIRLGPDEWTILAPADAVAGLAAACAAVYGENPHSLVDISGREVTLLIEGQRAAELLTLGCPRDIDTIPAGEGRRTLFDGANVVLWRDAEDRFRMDVWNSFADHVAHLLETGCKELAAEPA
ncbi:MAG: sarcosine oxidase subunit gamma family protein [Aquamicrobium sp.]|uniref:sarcosine oxidase subunit gamma family protein n=1 Tax=Aquamicrobium sp. TaxID=1872579 RepID=UPI00349E638F|nr:sarcosine oxidase subunit gamma family protein [Aquamicrobium sp.]